MVSGHLAPCTDNFTDCEGAIVGFTIAGQVGRDAIDCGQGVGCQGNLNLGHVSCVIGHERAPLLGAYVSLIDGNPWYPLMSTAMPWCV